MNKEKINLWNRDFELEVRYDCFEDEEELLPEQRIALGKLLDKPEIMQNSLPAVKEYCLKSNSDMYPEGKIENIFKYVIPRMIYVVRARNDRSVAIMCDYRFDLEHGIAILFKNEKLEKVGTQDMVL